MNHNTSPAEVLLYTLLVSGPSCSRDVQSLMAERQFTPKQVRHARERLGVLAERSGNGSRMRSTWRLPGGGAVLALGADGGEPDPADPACSASRSAIATALTEGERSRHRARFVAFTRQGMDATEAHSVANALVARDRSKQRAAGSCAECQCLALKTCPTKPRPAAEIHECWYRRQCTP